ncbi:MAG: DUF4411 family protein [Acaryochloridaceae cyanobacterium CSU_3_4]|nr:DUF4411 family protein [Acaryochloridaceae cyanobacterium CSU_3_4]
MIYVFDTSSLVVLKNFYPNNFPTLWEQWNSLVAEGTVVSVREVKEELANRSDSDVIDQWAKKHKSIFLLPSPKETEFVRNIFSVSHFQALVSQQSIWKGTPVADPFVIAAAAVRSGTVVTEESLKPNAAKIPNVCQHFGVHCINLEGFMNQQDWSF